MILLFQYRLELTQRELNLLTGATPDGTSEHHLIRALKVLGFRYEEGSKGTRQKLMDFLRAGLAPMVHVVLEDGGGHFMLVTSMTDNDVWLADPRSGTIIQYGMSFFLGVWKEEANDNNTPWYLAVTGYAAHNVDKLIGKYKKIKIKVERARK
jgi:ABC-type bacteriocin/lantibiotic exporter with double-glycine peptidase domain